MTVAEITKAAFRLVTRDRNPTSEEYADMLEALNLMLQEWATGHLGLHQVTRENFTISSGTAEYTIGSGQTFDTSLPIKIHRAFVRQSNVDYPVEIYSAADYARQTLKSTVQTRPWKLYFERGASSGTILLYPVPDQNYSLHLYSYKPLATYTSVSDDLGLPPEYEPAIKYNLAIDIAPEFGANLDQSIVARATQNIRSLKRLHSQPVPKTSTGIFGVRGQKYDINGDTYY